MSKHFFTEEQQDILRSNPYTKFVSSKTLKYTDEFKEEFCRKYLEGFSAREIFEQAGYDLNMIGEGRIHNTTQLILKDIKESTNPRGDEIKRLTAECKAMRKELEILKKLSHWTTQESGRIHDG